MTTLKTTTLVALVLTGGLALTGCTSTPEVITPPVSTSPAPVVVDPPVETLEPEVVAPKTGDILTVEPTDLGPSQRAFPLGDGTWVIVDRYEPLPAGVQDILNAQATEAVVYFQATTQGDADRHVNDAMALRSATSAATGKTVWVVYRTNGSMGCRGSGPDPWSYLGAKATSHDGCAAWATQAEAVAAAQGQIDVRQDANAHVVIVAGG